MILAYLDEEMADRIKWDRLRISKNPLLSQTAHGVKVPDGKS